jgi:hypothetical protein
VKGELRDVLIRLSSDPRVHQTIYIVVVDIFSLPQQRELLHDSFKPQETQKETIAGVEN